MKGYLVFLLLLIHISSFSQDRIKVKAGEGFSKIKLGENDFKEIKNELGNKYQVKKRIMFACTETACNMYIFTTVTYQDGIKLFFEDKDRLKGKRRVQGELYKIEICNSKFAISSWGIELQKMNFKSLVEIVGPAKKLSIQKDILFARYDGIEFYFESTSTPNKNLSYTDFLDAPLIRIAITK